MKIRLLYLTGAVILLLAGGCGKQDVADQDYKLDRMKGKRAQEKQPITPAAHPFEFRFADTPQEVVHSDNTTAEYYDPLYKGSVGEMKSIRPGKINHQADNPFLSSKMKFPEITEIIDFQSVDLPDKYILAEFDNDIFDNTDYYFTNGIKLGFFSPAVGNSPLSRALLPDLKGGRSYYGLVFVQNMYTPIEIERVEVQYGDRPFAAYLYLGHQKINCLPERRIRLTSEFDLGIIGSAAMGSFVQGTIHEHEPVGWKNQVQNDLLLNYSVSLDKGLISLSWLEAGMKAGAQAGTLYDNLSAGLFLVAGKTNGYYLSPFLNTGGGQAFKKRIRYYFTVDINSRFVAYDATLEGGIFNNGNVYSIPRSQLERIVFTGSAGIGIGMGRFSLEANQVYISPEFKDGRSHLWFGIKTILSF